MIDDESLSKVIHTLSAPISTRPEDFASSLHVAAQETKARQGVSILSAKSCSRRKIRIKVDNQLMMKNVEETPDTRQVAVYDIYNAISYAAMNHVLVPLCKPQLILNYDATQFRVGYGTNGCVSVVIPETEKNMKHKVMKRKDNKGITAYYIKYMCLISAFGFISEPVFLVADSNMSKEDIDVQEVMGLGVTSTVTKGYVVFCQSRAGNASFFEWFNQVIVLGFIESIRTNYKWQSEDHPVYVTMCILESLEPLVQRFSSLVMSVTFFSDQSRQSPK